ncbi:hypothetical protein MCOR19_008831 [Pyricularia oryzae]|nr:hypothetical protein MCOR19_008831 [Pyricularia oryzae]KAI6490587.1 hypothetical protein MCOR18_002276 [Pyricularia oryzae]
MCQFSVSDYASCGHIVFERPESCLFKGSELLCESFPMIENRYPHCCPKCTIFPTRRANTIPAPSPPQSHLRKAFSLPTLNNAIWRPFRPRTQAPVEWRRTRMVHKLMVDRITEQVLDRAREVSVEPAEMHVPSALLWCIREEGEEVGSLNWGPDMTADRESCASGYGEALDWCWIREDSVPKSDVAGLDNVVFGEWVIVNVDKSTGSEEPKKAMIAKEASVVESTSGKYVYRN